MDEMKEYIIKVNVNGKLVDECLSVLQAKELVRCKNCKHYKETTGVCAFYHAHGSAETWFCADGERRTD